LSIVNQARKTLHEQRIDYFRPRLLEKIFISFRKTPCAASSLPSGTERRNTTPFRTPKISSTWSACDIVGISQSGLVWIHHDMLIDLSLVLSKQMKSQARQASIQ
jgi:hypothetical protein